MIKDKDVERVADIVVFDVPEEKGIQFVFNVIENMSASVFVSDDDAEELVKIVLNKLNARR